MFCNVLQSYLLDYAENGWGQHGHAMSGVGEYKEQSLLQAAFLEGRCAYSCKVASQAAAERSDAEP